MKLTVLITRIFATLLFFIAGAQIVKAQTSTIRGPYQPAVSVTIENITILMMGSLLLQK